MREHFDPPIAVALDRPDLPGAIEVVDALAGRVRVFKVGFELFTAAGPAAVAAVRERGCEVFLDLKVNDIPNTAAGAVRSAAKLDARFLTIHGSGGREMVRAAVEATDGGRPQLLVVSVLTSLDDTALGEVGVDGGTAAQVDRIAAMAAGEGATGLVCAATDVARVRAAHPDMFLLVPGMRPAWAGSDDQRRMGTPAQALADGADLLVLGRAVTAADDPGAALDRVLDELPQGSSR